METEEISKKYIKKGLSDFKEKDLDYCKDFHEEDNIYFADIANATIFSIISSKNNENSK